VTVKEIPEPRYFQTDLGLSSSQPPQDPRPEDSCSPKFMQAQVRQLTDEDAFNLGYRQTIVDQHDRPPRAPLSFQAVLSGLARDSHDVARRTLAESRTCSRGVIL